MSCWRSRGPATLSMSERKLSGTTQKNPVSIAHATRIMDTAPLRLRQCRQMRARNSRTVSAVPSTLIAGRIEVRGTGDQHTIRRVAIMRNVLAAVLIAGTNTLPAQGTSKWVYQGPNQKLQYATDARGNRIMDFSYAGYGGGGVRLPDVRNARSLEPTAGDNTLRIQAAIDEVSRLPPDANGVRGAVVLQRGTYEVTGQLKIGASGVVLRGSGPGNDGTVIRVGGPPHRFLDIGGTGSWQPDSKIHRDHGQVHPVRR